MTDIQRQRIVWTGFPGGPGLTTLYFDDAAAAQDAVRDWLGAMGTTLPSDVTLTMQPGGDVISAENGALTAVWAGTVHPPVVGSAPSSVHAAPAGYLVRWETATIVAGSRLRGRSYIVPCSATMFGTDGTLDEGAMVGIIAATAGFVGAVTPNLVVWQRPRVARAAYTDGYGRPHKALSGRAGSKAPVISSSIPDEAVVLRTRRD